MIASIVERFGLVIAVTAVLLLPLGVLTVILLTRRRRANGWEPGWALRASVAEVGVVVGSLPWLWMLFTPAQGERGIQLIPFADLTEVLGGSDSVVQLVGNLLAFAALGAFVPIRFRLAPLPLVPLVAGLIGAAASTLVEVLQYVLDIGRVSSIDDAILNAAGALLASLVTLPWWRARRESREKA